MAVTIPGTSIDGWGKLELITAVATELITTAEAKTHLRVTTSDDDAYIDALIIAARQMVEAHTRIKWASAEYYYWMDQFPGTDVIRLQDVGYCREAGFVIEYYDTDGSLQTFAASNYTVTGKTVPPRIFLAKDSSWPSTATDRPGVRIHFNAGYTLATGMATPKPIIQAMLLIIGHLYENRQDVVDRIQYTMPQGAAYLVQPYRDLTA